MDNDDLLQTTNNETNQNSDDNQPLPPSPPIRFEQNWMNESEINTKNRKSSIDFNDILKDIDELERALADENDPQTQTANSSNASCDDIASILRALEDEDQKSQKKIENLRQLTMETNGEKTMESNRNHEELLRFLDEIDQNKMENLKNLEKYQSRFGFDTIPKFDELILQQPTDLANELITALMRAKEQRSTIALLRNELNDVRRQLIEKNANLQKLNENEKKTMKKNYESTIIRHQTFIDRLINDKKSLNRRCAELLAECETNERRHANNLQAIEQRHRTEMDKLKAMQVAGEKIRRERWIDARKEKIRAQTAKSLAPEIEAIEQRHRTELAELRSLHQRHIESLESKHGERMRAHGEEVRAQEMVEREKILTDERELMRQRYDMFIAEQENNYQEQRKRLLADHSLRLIECEQYEKRVNSEKEKQIKQAKDEFEQKLMKLEKIHANDLEMARRTLTSEMDAWCNAYVKKQTVILEEKEKTICEKYRQERDEKIEKIIEQFEMETNDTKQQMEESYENRISRLKTKYEKDINELEMSEKETKQKYIDAKKCILEKDECIIKLENIITNLESDLNNIKIICNRMNEERENLEEIIRKETDNKIINLEQKIITIKQSRDKELQQISQRVKLSINRKEEMLIELREEYNAMQEKCIYLENLLEQQRKEYLSK